MNIGDRVKFKTIGGWYNSGIIKDMNEDSYLIEVDERCIYTTSILCKSIVV